MTPIKLNAAPQHLIRRRLFQAAASQLRVRHVAVCLAWAAILCPASQVSAAPIPWRAEQFEFSTVQSTLSDAIHEFSQQTHVPISVSIDVTGNIAGRFNITPQRFLDLLVSVYGLDWYYDGAMLRISPLADRRMLPIRLNYVTPDTLLAMLKESGATDSRFPLQVDETADVVIVSGPPDYVGRVAKMAAQLERAAREHVRTSVRVVKLDSAGAADRPRTVAGVNHVQPGVATLLRQRFAASRAQPQERGIVPLEYEAALPIIEADAGTNSVLVRDLPEKLDADAAMVEAYDVKPEQVQIVAYLAEVDPDALAALPLQWRPDANGVQVAYTDDDGSALAAQLEGFAKAGRARVEFKRGTLTIAGMPAVMDRYEDKLVQAQDAGDGSLLDVSTGVSLSVTPTLAGTPGDPRIALDAQISPGDDADGERMPLQHAHTDVASGQCVALAFSAPVAPAQARQDRPASATAAMATTAVAVKPRTRILLLIPAEKTAV